MLPTQTGIFIFGSLKGGVKDERQLEKLLITCFSRALFRSKIFLDFDIIALSFLFDKYYVTME